MWCLYHSPKGTSCNSSPACVFRALLEPPLLRPVPRPPCPMGSDRCLSFGQGHQRLRDCAQGQSEAEARPGRSPGVGLGPAVTAHGVPVVMGLRGAHRRVSGRPPPRGSLSEDAGGRGGASARGPSPRAPSLASGHQQDPRASPAAVPPPRVLQPSPSATWGSAPFSLACRRSSWVLGTDRLLSRTLQTPPSPQVNEETLSHVTAPCQAAVMNAADMCLTRQALVSRSPEAASSRPGVWESLSRPADGLRLATSSLGGQRGLWVPSYKDTDPIWGPHPRDLV